MEGKMKKQKTMRKIFFGLTVILCLAVMSCKKDKLTDPNEELIGDWILTETFSPLNGSNTSSQLKKTKWRLELDGKLKIYKNGIRKSIQTWERTLVVFYGAYDSSTGTFHMDTVQAIAIDHHAEPFTIDNNELKIFQSYVDGTDLYFKRKE